VLKYNLIYKIISIIERISMKTVLVGALLVLSVAALHADTLPTSNVPAAVVGTQTSTAKVAGATPEVTQPGTVAPGVGSSVAQATVPVAPGQTTVSGQTTAKGATAGTPAATPVPGATQEPVIVKTTEGEQGMPMPSGRPSQMTPPTAVQPTI
jgi:hypothetical protein